MSEQIEAFQPYVEEKEEKKRAGNPNHRMYTDAEDERILEVTGLAEREGIPLEAVWNKLSDELDRTPAALSARYYKVLKPNNDDDDSEGELAGGLLGRLKNIVKERNYYKGKYESMKAEYERVVPEYEKLTKELNKIRRMLGD